MPLAPGLYHQPVQPVRAAGPLARGDVPAFLGYTARGPAGAPVRVGSFGQFVELFGAPLAAHLGGAVKGFFETGGSAAYVVRVVDPAAAAAQATIGAGTTPWRAAASFAWPVIDPRLVDTRAGSAPWTVLYETQIRERGRRSPDPGTWGDRVTVTIARAAAATTETLPGRLAEGWASRVASLAGIEAASIVELAQDTDGIVLTRAMAIAAIDPARQSITWATPPESLGFDPARAMRLATVEFTIDVAIDGRLDERFAALGVHPAHSRSLHRVVAGMSRHVDLAPAFDWGDATDWADPALWPTEGTTALGGGRDGVTAVAAGDWLRALGAVARADEVALVAAPDLVLGQIEERAPAPSRPVLVDCCDLSPPRPGRLRGIVVSGDGAIVRRASVEVVGSGGRALTGEDGGFALAGLTTGLVTLRLAAPGYAPLETLAQASEFDVAPERIVMARLTRPRALADDEILRVQQAMAEPSIVGPYRVAIVDPPRPDARIEELRTWRAKLGDSARLAFFAPWLRVPAIGDGGTLLPPSGHVCGAIAAGEAAAGIHRSPANIELRHIDGLALAIDDAEQGLLNPAGINAIRALPGRGIRLWGTRTLASDPDWRQLTTRRLIDQIERTCERALSWAPFEPNSLITRQAVGFTIAGLLGRLWRQGALAGASPAEAFHVKCDIDNNPADTRDAGRLIAEVAVAPAVPFEFVVFRIGRAFDAIDVTE